MDSKMSGLNECFSIGSIVTCKTCYNQDIEGEVVAFDPQTKMLVLKCPSTSGNKLRNNVQIVNLSWVSDVQVLKEVNNMPENLPPLNIQRINKRLKMNIEEKQRLAKALAAGVSPEGRSLFLTISKTITDIQWDGANILVLNSVTITPPYTLDNIIGDSESKAYIHIRKVVEKHIKDRALEKERSMASSSSSSSEGNSVSDISSSQ